MRFEFKNNNNLNPEVSIILLDWSCRESFHILHYLCKQTIPREKYEIIWIEYFGRKAHEIEKCLEESHKSGTPPVVDKWLIMDMPDQIYYHKHLMYNIGIIASEGRIFTICDSDAVVNPTFIESIIKSFKKDSSLVLHMDEVRSIEKRFYPFNYPSTEEIVSSRSLNLIDGKPRGLVDRSAPFHLPNYGACFSALREDIITIGGADEHIDYLGHICGPYEMTFRLINAGRKEVWHPKEWLYHVWHPGQSGDNNYAGPHDGRHMSQTALSVRKTGRVFPLVENQAIKMLRLEKDKNILETSLFESALSGAESYKWDIDSKRYSETKYWIGSTKIKMRERESSAQQGMKDLRKDPLILLNLIKIFIIIFVRELCDRIPLIKEFLFRRNTTSQKPSQNGMALVAQEVNSFNQFVHLGFRFLKRLVLNDIYIIGRCQQCVNDLRSIGINEVVLFGTSTIADLISILSEEYSIKIKALYDNTGKKFRGYDVYPLDALKGYRGKIIIASFSDVEKKAEMLKRIGIKSNMIIDLW